MSLQKIGTVNLIKNGSFSNTKKSLFYGRKILKNVMNKEKVLLMDYKYLSDKILIRRFKSAQPLKDEIRKRIRMRQKCGWHFGGMTNHGPYVILCFRKLVEITPSYKSRVNLECLDLY